MIMLSYLRRALFAFLISGLPLLATAATAAPTDFKSLTTLVIDIISAATALLVGLGIVYYLWGIAISIGQAGSAKTWENFRTRILWGILVLFVIVSIWGILRLLGNTLFGTNNFSSL